MYLSFDTRELLLFFLLLLQQTRQQGDKLTMATKLGI